MKLLFFYEFLQLYRGKKDIGLWDILIKLGADVTVVFPDVVIEPDPEYGLTKRDRIEKIKEMMPTTFDKLNIIFLKGFKAYLPFKGQDKRRIPFAISFGIFSTILKENPDLIINFCYSTLTPTTYFTYLSAKMLNKKLVILDCGDVVYRTDFRKKFCGFFEKEVFEYSKIVITYSLFAKKRFIEEYKLKEDKVIVIPKGVDTEFFNISSRAPHPPNNFRVLSTCRYEKGGACLLKIAKKMKDIDFYVTDKKFGVDGDNIHILEKCSLSELPNRYNMFDVVVQIDAEHPPEFSTVTAEAASCGVPQIIGNWNSQEAIPLRNNIEYLSAKANDVAEFVSLITLLKDMKTTRDLFSWNSRKFAVKNLDFKVIGKKHYKIFKEMI